MGVLAWRGVPWFNSRAAALCALLLPAAAVNKTLLRTDMCKLGSESSHASASLVRPLALTSLYSAPLDRSSEERVVKVLRTRPC